MEKTELIRVDGDYKYYTSSLVMSKKRKTDEAATSLYCVCRQPNDESQMMIQCDFCDTWFHPKCVNVEEEEAEELSKWHCPGCVEAMEQNPNLSKKGLLSFQGRCAPKSGWSDSFPVTDIDDCILSENIQTKRHRIEGYNLFREGKVLSLSSVTSENGVFIYFKGSVAPSMKDKSYGLHICLKNGGQKLKWANCECPAGNDGQCKHIVAMLYQIIDMFRQGISKIPEVKTCTDKLQMWHVRKPLTDEPLLFCDIQFVKHDPFKVCKKELCSTVKYHNPVPKFGQSVNYSQLERLTNLFNNSGVNLPVMATIKSNNFQPAIPKTASVSELDHELYDKVKSTQLQFNKPELNDKESQFFRRLVEIDIEQSQLIEKNTRLQAKNAFWFQEREYRLTGSIMGTFCKLKPETDPVKTYKQKKVFFTSKSVKHGIEYENVAFSKYCETRNIVDGSVGLVINPQVPFLGVSPDRIVKEGNELKLIEIKCPFSLYDKKKSIDTQIKSGHFYLQRSENGTALNRKHDYFFQIQGQLNICGIDKCDLVVFVPPNDMTVVEVVRDQQFFNICMLPKLTEIFFSSLLPNFVK